MTNTSLLREYIKKSGLKISFIAEQLGISRSWLTKKINDEVSFNQYEIADLCRLLHIETTKEKESVFFASM